MNVPQKEYWDNKIQNWTSASYRKPAPTMLVLERVATFFRAVEKRLKVTLQLVGPLVVGKKVIDLGCGLGDACFALHAYHPESVVGVDISEVAVKDAQEMAKTKGLAEAVTFIQGDAASLKELPPFDIAIGLGFIDYLDKQEMAALFELLRGRLYFFSYFEKKASFITAMHALYLKIQKCPGAYKYSRKEIDEMLPKDCGNYFVEKDGLLFITNIPELKKWQV